LIIRANNKKSESKFSNLIVLNNNYFFENPGNYFVPREAGLASVSSTSKIKASNALNGGLAFAPYARKPGIYIVPLPPTLNNLSPSSHPAITAASPRGNV
jgi:hypothetical protein